MALAIDASSPAIVVQNSSTVATATTASFTPPTGSLLYIRWVWNTGGGDTPAAPTVTDNLGSHLTYTLLDHRTRADSPAVDGQAAHWWAVGTGTAMTVTTTAGTGTTLHLGAMQVLVFTDTGTPSIGAHGKAGQASNTSIAQGFTATATGSMGLLSVSDWDNATHAAGSGMTYTNGGTGIPNDVHGSTTYVFMRRTAFDGTSGASTTLNDTITGATANLSWVYAEVVPAVGSAWTYGFDIRIGG